MADDTQKIEYKFDGDARGLRNATADAIKSMTKLESAFKRATMVGAVDTTAEVTQKFATRIKTATNNAKSLSNQVSKLNRAGSKAMAKNTAEIEKITQLVDKLGAVVGSAANIDPKTMQVYLDVLAKASKAMASWTKTAKVMTSYAPTIAASVHRSSAAIQEHTRQVVIAVAANKTLKASTDNTKAGFEGARTEAIKWNQVSRSLVDQTGSSMAVAFRKLKLQLADVPANFKSMGESMKTSASGAAQKVTAAWSKLTGFITERFPATASVLKSWKSTASATFTGLRKSLSSVWSGIRRVGKQAKDSGDDVNDFTNENKKSAKASGTFSSVLALVASKLSNLTKRTHSYNKASRTMRGLTHLLSTAFYKLTGLGVGEWLGNMATSSMNFVENMNLFKVAMGDSVEEGQKFVDTMSEMYGLDANSLIKYAGNFYQLSDAINMPAEAASKLSLGLTKATVDIASLFNRDFDEVFNSLSSGMQGMTKAVRKFGMDIRVVTLQTKAMELGIYDDVDAMSEADRQALRYIVMVEQASNANSDFARTIEAPANQLRIFKEQTMALGRAIGNFFLAPLQKAAQYINGFVMALRSVISFIADSAKVLTDFSADVDLSDASDQVSGLGTAADDAAKSVKDLLAPFDELNVISRSSGSSGGGLSDSELLNPKLAEAIANMDTDLTKIKMRAQEVREAILSFWGFDYNMNEGILGWSQEILKANLQEKFPKYTKTIESFFANWTQNTQALKAVWKGFGDVVSQVLDDIKTKFEEIVTDEGGTKFFEELGPKLQNFADFLSGNKEKIAGHLELIAKLFVGYKLLSTVLSPLVTLFVNVAKGLSLLNLSGLNGVSLFGESGLLTKGLGLLKTGFSALTSPIGLVVTAFVLMMTASEDFRGSVGNLIKTLGELLFTLLEPIVDIIKLLVDALLPPLMDIFKTLGDALAPVLDLLTEIIEALMPIVQDVIDTIIYLVDLALDIITDLLDAFKGVIESIAEILGGVMEVIDGILTGDFKKIGHGFLKILAGIANTLISVVEGVVNLVIGAVNTGIRLLWDLIVGAINGILSGISWLLDLVGISVDLSVGWEAPQIPKLNIPRITVPALAEGGIVSSGQLFIANEAGPEYIGTMGGHTAVANNDQIVEGITRGVVDGIMQTGIIGYVRSIDQSARTTADKDFTLGKPSATAGRWIKQSSDAYNKVRG